MILRASLAARPRPTAEAVGRPLLDPAGAAIVLGTRPGPDGLAQPIVPGADTLFGPRGACLAGPAGPLYVSDTGHHRLLVWTRIPTADHQPADLVIGQPDFGAEGRNARRRIGAATLNVPTGVAAGGGVLALADAWNHRVLLWHDAPVHHDQPADVVLGQVDAESGQANRGREAPAADTLNWCYGVAIADGKLYVADTGNRRVLVWNQLPTWSGAPADLVLGQRDFTSRDENAGAAASAMSMRWPHGITATGDGLGVADAGNNRVMLWQGAPQVNGQPCDLVLGQRDASGVDHNQAAYLPTSRTLSMPYGLALLGDRLVIADTANSRLVGHAKSALVTDAPAAFLAGQRAFADKGDNRWRPATRDSLCWPYGVAAMGATLVVADAGNNRVLLWTAAS